MTVKFGTRAKGASGPQLAGDVGGVARACGEAGAGEEGDRGEEGGFGTSAAGDAVEEVDDPQAGGRAKLRLGRRPGRRRRAIRGDALGLLLAEPCPLPLDSLTARVVAPSLQ